MRGIWFVFATKIGVLIIGFSVPTQAETVKYLDNGELALSALYSSIRSATQSIDLSYYEVHECDSSTKVLVEAIRGRSQELQRQGKKALRVRVMADYFPFRNMQAAQLWRAFMRINGIESKIFNTTGLQNRSHAKYAIIDGRILITGGRNIGDAYFGMKPGAINYVDRDVLVEGSAAQQAQAAFNRVWKSAYAHGLDREDIQDLREARKSCLAFGTRERRLTQHLNQNATAMVAEATPFQCGSVQFVADTRVRFQPKATALKLLSLLKAADRSIHIENYSYWPVDRFDTLMKQKREQVQVQVFTNHFERNKKQSDHDHLHRFYVARDNQSRQANFPMSLSQRPSQDWKFTPPGTVYQIHSKVYVVDTKHVAVTSSNIDPLSLSYKRNLESNVAMSDCPELAYHAEMKTHEMFRELHPNEQRNMRNRISQYKKDESSRSVRSVLQSMLEGIL